MSDMSSDGGELMQLLLDPVLRVAGEELNGAILLDFRFLQKEPLEEVHVKLRGSILTRSSLRGGQLKAVVNLVHDNISLWRKGFGYPSPGEHLLKLPFQFALPAELLPSFESSNQVRAWIVEYSLEAVGVRAGFNTNKRIFRPIPLLPYNLHGAQLRDALKPTWNGETRFHKSRTWLREFIWEEYSKVTVKIGLPDIPQLPIFAPIPVTICVVTLTKPMRREDGLRKEPLFPVPPRTPRDVEFKLQREIIIGAGPEEKREIEDVTFLAGFGLPSQSCGHATPQTLVAEKVWVNNTDGRGKTSLKGRWKQETTFLSTFELSCPPTFESATLTAKYRLALKFKYPGVFGDDVRSEVPITIVSSMPPPCAGSSTWDTSPPPPLPEVDLPPYESAPFNQYDAGSEL